VSSISCYFKLTVIPPSITHHHPLHPSVHHLVQVLLPPVPSSSVKLQPGCSSCQLNGLRICLPSSLFHSATRPHWSTMLGLNCSFWVPLSSNCLSTPRLWRHTLPAASTRPPMTTIILIRDNQVCLQVMVNINTESCTWSCPGDQVTIASRMSPS